MTPKRSRPGDGARGAAMVDGLASLDRDGTANGPETEALRFDLIGDDACAFDLGGERVVIRRAAGPLCAAARAAIARGVDPARPIVRAPR